MKKILSVVLAAFLAISFGAISSSSASAISCKAFNKGTYNAAHMVEAQGKGLYKIADACHGG
jgi:hypothetical protein